MARIRKPLLSPAKMNELGNDVNLASKSPHIKNIKMGEVTRLKKRGRTFVLSMWVWIPAVPSKGFARRP